MPVFPFQIARANGLVVASRPLPPMFTNANFLIYIKAQCVVEGVTHGVTHSVTNREARSVLRVLRHTNGIT